VDKRRSQKSRQPGGKRALSTARSGGTIERGGHPDFAARLSAALNAPRTEHKVTEAWREFQCPVLVEDSGLLFTAWNGLPGALVKWFEKSVGCAGMLKMLEPFENRRAEAVCLTALYDGTTMVIGEGRVSGTIAREIRGSHGFGWDVIFIPDDETRTYAEMSPEEKNARSHRRQAFESLKSQL